ncbi:LysE family translocator [Leifsonia sp. L25]|uniref:LysE family translocator n=1 Tax=Actinomycetes TaxID=1760 RepID=UPI003D687070
MNPALVAQFWTIAVLLALTPGADWAYIMGAGVRAKSAAPSILGMLTAYALVLAAVALGVGALVTRFPVVLTVLTLGGGAYLIWLGITALVKRSEPVGPHGEPIVGSATSQFLRGAGSPGSTPRASSCCSPSCRSSRRRPACRRPPRCWCSVRSTWPTSR